MHTVTQCIYRTWAFYSIFKNGLIIIKQICRCGSKVPFSFTIFYFFLILNEENLNDCVVEVEDTVFFLPSDDLAPRARLSSNSHTFQL